MIKDKYKYKYKKLKAQFAVTSNSENEFVPFQEEFETKKNIFKDENPYSLRRPKPEIRPSSGDVGKVISKIRDSLCEFIEKISNANRKLERKSKGFNKK